MIYLDLSCKANGKKVTFIMIYHDTSQYITICNNTSERGRVRSNIIMLARPEAMTGSGTGNHDWKSKPEVIPEVMTGSGTGSGTGSHTRRVYRNSFPEVVPEV